MKRMCKMFYLSVETKHINRKYNASIAKARVAKLAFRGGDCWRFIKQSPGALRISGPSSLSLPTTSREISLDTSAWDKPTTYGRSIPPVSNATSIFKDKVEPKIGKRPWSVQHQT